MHVKILKLNKMKILLNDCLVKNIAPCVLATSYFVVEYHAKILRKKRKLVSKKIFSGNHCISIHIYDLKIGKQKL